MKGAAARLVLRGALACAVFAYACAGQAAEPVSARLARFLAEVGSGQGEFTQTVIAGSGRKPQRSSGEFAFRRPGRFLWLYRTPYRQKLVGDGERMWAYDEDLNQVTVRKLGDALGATPAAILAGEGDLARNFVLEDGGSAGGLDWIAARPRAADSAFEEMRLGFEGDHLRAMWIKDSFGQLTELRFERFERNPQLAEGLFRFQPPPGADVVGD